MRKINQLAYAWAIALLSLGFQACSSEEDVADVNPTYNPETGELVTQFAFSVATNNNATRMSSESTQATGGNFRGISNARILAYQLGQKKGSNFVASNEKDAAKIYDLGNILAKDAIDQSNENNKSNRVIELSLPLSTDNIMFYGRASKESTDTPDKVGSVDATVSTKTADTKFSLVSRIGTNGPLMENMQEVLAEVLTRIANTKLDKEAEGQGRDFRYVFIWDQSHAAGIQILPDEKVKNKHFATKVTINKELFAKCFPDDGTQAEYKNGVDEVSVTVGDIIYQGKIYFGTRAWRDYGLAYKDKKTVNALQEILGKAWDGYTQIKDFDKVENVDGKDIRMIGARAGSGSAINSTLTDLYQVALKVNDASATFAEEFEAQILAARLIRRLLTYCTVNDAHELTLKDYSGDEGLTGLLKTYNGKTFSFGDIAGNPQGFPTQFGLPAGSAQLHYGQKDSEADRFYYDNGNVKMGVGESGTDVTKIAYPAEILYFGNSPIRTTSATVEAKDYPNGTVEWVNDNSWSMFTDAGDVVNSTTRSVAMKYNIQYGTALLKTTVKYGVDDLKDNMSKLNDGQADQTFTASRFPLKLTGVLIGGQTKDLGWNYIYKEPAEEESVKYDYVIYDRAVGDYNNNSYEGIELNPTVGTLSDPVYTLVFDNYTKEAKQNDVYVALELVNADGNGAFAGAANIVRPGGTFYLVGKLKAEDLSTDNANFWPTDYPMSPYTTTDTGSNMTVNGTKTPRVFIQDYTTEANFVIGENSLKSAYVTVPDLRSSQLSLGLSVDLQWRTGITFNDVTLGQ